MAYKKPYTYKKDLQTLFYIIYILRKVVSFLEEYKIIERRNFKAMFKRMCFL